MQRRPSAPLTLGFAILVLGIAGCMDSARGTPPPPTVLPASVPPASGAPATPAATPTVLWPAPADPMERTVAAGLKPEPKEYLENHVHAHLDVFLDGAPIGVPPGIGIDTTSPDVTKFALPDGTISYGGIELCGQPCISPLHTHDESGILHTEAATFEPHTLGQFFLEWGVGLSAECVGEFCAPDKPIAVYVNGEAYTGDPNAIELTDLKEIAIVIGTPPDVIPSTADFSNA